ncbi:MAG: DinB family protein [Fibrobacteres bacterium]|nr:DinB family protein [Fibrobacterota bacterium]
MTNRLKDYINIIDKLETAVSALTETQLDKRIAPDKWTPREVIAHLLDSEIIVYARFRSILADKVPYISNHDESRWTKAFAHDKSNATENMKLLRIMRKLNYDLLVTLNDEQLNMKGLHSTRGYESVRHFIEAYIVHVENHIGQIGRNS